MKDSSICLAKSLRIVGRLSTKGGSKLLGSRNKAGRNMDDFKRLLAFMANGWKCDVPVVKKYFISESWLQVIKLVVQ